MAWTSPPTVATGDLLTAAMWNTYIRDNTNHLRALTGGADPAAVNKTLLSSGAAAAVWQSVLDTTIYSLKKVNQINPIYTTFAGALDGGSGFFTIENTPGGVADGPVPGVLDWHLIQSRYYSIAIDWRLQIAARSDSVTELWIRWIMAGTPTAWVKIWFANNDGDGSGLDAHVLKGIAPGNANGQIAVNNGSENINLNAAMLNGMASGNASGQIPRNNGTLNTNLNAAMLNGVSWHTGLQASQSSDLLLTTSYQDLPGASVVLNRNGSWLILAVAKFEMQAADGYGDLQIMVNGAPQTPEGMVPAGFTMLLTASTFTIVAASSGHVAKLRADKQFGTGTSEAVGAKIVAIWLG